MTNGRNTIAAYGKESYGVRQTEAWEWMVELSVLACMGGAYEEGRRGVQETDRRSCGSCSKKNGGSF